MNIRTYDADSDVDAEQMTHFDAHAELAAYVAEVGRLRTELAGAQDMATAATQAWRTVTAERDTLRHKLADAETRANLASELMQRMAEDLAHERQQHRDTLRQLDALRAELGNALDMALAERDEAYREMDAQTLKANSFRSELYRYIAHANELKEMLDISVIERDALRAELDAMREAHSVIQARMAAMGC